MNGDLTEAQVRELLREKAAGMGGAKNLAADIPLDLAHLNRILAGKRGVSDSASRAVGYRQVIVFRPVEDDGRAPSPSPENAPGD